MSTNPPEAKPTLVTEEEVSGYLAQVIKGEVKIGEGLEAQALAEFKAVSSRVDGLENNLQQIQMQAGMIKAQVNEARGELKAYVNILVGAERGRRENAEALKDEEITKARKKLAEVPTAEVESKMIRGGTGANEGVEGVGHPMPKGSVIGLAKGPTGSVGSEVNDSVVATS